MIYAFFWGLAWGCAYRLSRFLLLKKGETLEGLRGLLGGSFLAGWLGAKGLFALMNGHLLLGDWGFWLGAGGFVFYGGFLGVALFVLFYSLVLKRFSARKLFFFLPPLAFGHGIGRVGCFFVGCCHGHHHPVQLYEALGLTLLGFYLLKKVLAQRLEWGERDFFLLPYFLFRHAIFFRVFKGR